MQIRLLPRRLIGQTIRGIRNRVGMSQAEFAAALGAESGAVVARWEKGQAQPEYGTLAKIAAMGLVDVLVFHETASEPAPQVTPGEAAELREIFARMEALLSDARAIVDRAANRTAVEVLEAATGSAARTPPASADALVLDAEVRLETRPRSRSRPAAKPAPSAKPRARARKPSSAASKG
jgi:transcriptional regulator with XRE-family HTH domain